MKKPLARPIKTARDRKNAAAVAKKTHGQTGSEPAAERRLQALLNEIEKFDSEGEEEEFDGTAEDIDGLPRRRWSDDVSDEA